MNKEKLIEWLNKKKKELSGPGGCSVLHETIASEKIKLIREIIQHIKSEPEETCTYDLYEEDANTYKCSACDELWVLNADTPKDNNMNYCPNCGRKIIEKAGE